MFNPLNETSVNGNRTLYGTGTSAFSMDAIGLGQNQVLGTGTSTIAMDASADGELGASGVGACQIAMNALAVGSAGLVGTGTAVLSMTCTHGIPDPHSVPATFSTGHPSRHLLVDAKPRPINEE